ncbi:MAG: LysR family transcriptional regulator [Hyphomicrobiales bacterium]|nr:MAG: LysR family transcriptional regulator [Hyphomicrobiales bacterium]
MSTTENLETFVAAVRAGSFAGAARQLGLSPAMVGRRIQALEERYGARLIERTTRAQRLTALGESFFAQAEHVLEATAELDELTKATPGRLEGRIRLTGPATLGTHRLAAIVARFCEAHPAVTVEMSLNDRRADLIAEGFDFAVRIGELQVSAMIARPVGTYRLLVCAAPAYLSDHPAPSHPADLVQHRCLINLNMLPRGRWPFVSPQGETVVAEVEGQLQIDNGEAQKAAALEGAGIVYLPEDLAGADLDAGRLVQVLPEWRTLTLPINLVYPTRRLVPRRVTALMDAIASGLKE